MELVGNFFVFFVVYGTLQYLFTERKRNAKDGRVQSSKTALLRSAGTAALGGFLYVLFMEVIEIF
ncbi:MAG: hypothetical protein R6V29_10695 [Spirochaetia bacterium]